MTGDIIDRIRKEHDKTLSDLDGLIREGGSGGQDSRAEGFLMIERDLQTHMYGEEKVFYPLMEGTLQERIAESLDDHDRIRRGMREVFGAQAHASEWRSALQALRTLVQFHIRSEDQMLKELREGFGDAELEEMCRRFEVEKQNYLGALAELTRSAGGTL